jgi:hypothetical protein
MSDLFNARDITIKFKANSGYDKTGSALPSASFSSGATEIYCKDFKITPGEKPFDQQDYTGEDADGFQNQAKIHKPIGKNSIEMTVDNNGLVALKSLLSDTVDTTSITGYTRLQNGNAARRTVDCLAIIDNGTDVGEWVVLNAEQVAPEDSLTGTDGVMEYKIKLEALARDYDEVIKNAS